MKNINIVFAVDDNYSDKLYVTIFSILENNQNDINFYIINQNISRNNQEKILNLELYYKNCHINFITLNSEILDNLKLNIPYITKETYYRYLIADLLLNEDKALYLDADIIVDGDITPLYNLDISNYYCAGSEDLFIKNLNYKQEINFKNNDLYINAGVLLLNLQKIRELNLGKQLIDKTIELNGKIKYQDQDVINIVFKNYIKAIDSKYNFASANVKEERRKKKEERRNSNNHSLYGGIKTLG